MKRFVTNNLTIILLVIVAVVGWVVYSLKQKNILTFKK